jgi:hypothetical protein
VHAGITNRFPLCTAGFRGEELGLRLTLASSSLSLASKLSSTYILTNVPWLFRPHLHYAVCDANRRALASRIGAFAEVHAGLGGMPVRIPTMIRTLRH